MKTLLLLSLFSFGALAQASSELDEARAAVESATSEYDLGHYKDALGHFEKAYRIKRVPALLFNIAQCHRMLGELKEAASVYRTFLVKDPESKHVEQARTLLAQLDDALNRQQQAQIAPPTDLTGRSDAQAADQPGAARAVELPGAAQPLVRADERADKPEHVVSPLPVEPEAAHAKPLVPRAALPEADPELPHRRLYTWVAGGVGVAALAVGGVFGLQSKSARSSLETLHSGTEVQDLQQKQVDNAKRANLFFVAGAVVVAAAAVLYVLEL